MLHHTITLPSKPRIVSDDGIKGTFEIDALYPGYGYTLGNSLRRIILSSLPGVAITSVKIDGVSHEFSVIEGVKEDVINILLNLRQVRFAIDGDEPVTVTLDVKGPGKITAADIKVPGQATLQNKDTYICELTGKTANLSMEITLEKGMGFLQKDQHRKEKVEIGTIALDALFTPIRNVSYDVEDMRIGDNTKFNRLRINIETDGSITPKVALEESVMIMIKQLEAVVEFQSDRTEAPATKIAEVKDEAESEVKTDNVDMAEVLKTRIDAIGLSARTLHALTSANIRTVGGIARKKSDDLLEIEGIGEKGILEIKKILSDYGISLK